MLVTQGLTILAAHRKQPIKNIVNLEQKKRIGALFTDANVMNTKLQLTPPKTS